MKYFTFVTVYTQLSLRNVALDNLVSPDLSSQDYNIQIALYNEFPIRVTSKKAQEEKRSCDKDLSFKRPMIPGCHIPWSMISNVAKRLTLNISRIVRAPYVI